MWKLMQERPRFIFFGLLLSFFSGPGQSYFISLFTPFLQKNLNLSLAAIGTCYGLATLLASFFLPYQGRKSDTGSLLPYLGKVTFCIVGGMLLISYASHWTILFAGYFLLRACAQGSLNLIYSSTISRLYGKNRGKALSLSNLGHALGQSLIPIYASYFLNQYGLQVGVWATAIIFLLFFYPIVFWLLQGQDTRTPLYAENEKAQSSYLGEQCFSFRDPRFWITTAGNILTPFILTGIFFHQSTFLASRGWSTQLYVQGLSIYALAGFFSSISIGILIDRHTARKLLPFNLCSLLLGLLVLYYGESSLSWFLFMGIMGTGPAASGTVKNALWAEIYGIKNIGKIRGVDSQLNVISTALGPIMAGALWERGVPINAVLFVFIFLTVGGIFLHVLASILYKFPHITFNQLSSSTQ